jgi:niacin transporter
MYKVLVVVGVGTILNHIVDGAIALTLIKAISKSLNFDLRKAS